MGFCKAELPWQGGHTLLSYQASNLLSAGITPIIVLGTHNQHCAQACPMGCHVVYNPDAQRGKISSILTGLQVLPEDFESVMISAVDQPRPVALYKQLLQAYLSDRARIVAPSYGNRIGHPLLFGRSLLPDLLNINESTRGLRAIVDRFYTSIRRLEWDSPEVLSDLNSPDVYFALKNQAIDITEIPASPTLERSPSLLKQNKICT